MADPQIQYDIRVVRMAKSTQETNLKSILAQMKVINVKRNKNGSSVNMNLCLGHFDVMMIDQVGGRNSNPMHTVIADYNKTMDLGRMLGIHDALNHCSSETTNYFPIYMLVQLNGNYPFESQRIDSFWRNTSNYTVIMRLHQKRDDSIELFRTLLVSRLEEVNPYSSDCSIQHKETVSKFYSKLEVCDNHNSKYTIECVFYDSLELGDVVGVFKGNSIWAILHIQRWLYESEHVSDAYSYCGVHYNLLSRKEIPECFKRNLPTTTLDYVETRFSVRDVHKAWDFLSQQGTDNYCVTGTADALLHYKSISEVDFLEKICQIVHNDQMYDAFSDIITRIGLANRKPPTVSTNTTSTHKPNEPIQLSNELISWLTERYKESNHPEGEIYVHSLEKLVSSLNAMLSNSVMDDLANLMDDGIKALIKQLEYYKENDYWNNIVGGLLQEFLDQWSSTMNEILHLESQLFQHPELIPVRFYIPAMILQFQKCILSTAVEAICNIDSPQNCKYVPIILPKSQPNTSTKAIFDPKKFLEYPQNSPLCIYLPIHMLYHPYRISLILCHEIAHYCGDGIRLRELRSETIKKCISFYTASRMIATMGLVQKNAEDDKIILSQVGKCADKIEYYFGHIIKDIQNVYLDDIINAMSQDIEPLITSPQVLNDIVEILLDGWSLNEQFRVCDSIKFEGYEKYADLVLSCQEHLDFCLSSLLRECFADVVMILLSNCTFNDYYMCMFHDEYENLKKTYSSKHPVFRRLSEIHTDRMALVACCISKVFQPNWTDKTPNECQADWKDKVRKKMDYWNKSKPNEPELRESQPLRWPKLYSESEGYSFVLTGNEAYYILNYLNQCAEKIKDKMESRYILGFVERLRKQIRLMQPDQMDWNELQRILIMTRQSSKG